jgi:rod shape-determining protein MreC
MSYVSAIADVELGDVVVTSGLDRIFPKGLLVGRVISLGPVSGLFREIRVAPSARFDSIEEVLVLKHPAESFALPRSVRTEPAS